MANDGPPSTTQPFGLAAQSPHPDQPVHIRQPGLLPIMDNAAQQGPDEIAFSASPLDSQSSPIVLLPICARSCRSDRLSQPRTSWPA